MVTKLLRGDERRALGRRIAELRHARALTQSALADELGAGMRYVQLLEGGTGNPTFLVLLDLADALGVAVASSSKRPGRRRHRGQAGQRACRKP